jgi:hypothetical protein
MNEIISDIILFDTVCIPYTGEDILNIGMGGSESQAIFLLEEFAKLGKRVICLNNTSVEKEYNGVLYLPNTYINKFKFKCNHLILHRSSYIPRNIFHKKCYQWVTDNNGPQNLPYYELIDNNKCTLITLSQYSNDQYPKNWNKHVINFMIPQWVYDYQLPENKSGFVYASSLMKGYTNTIQYWMYLKNLHASLKNKPLYVCLPGYDNPHEDISVANYDVNYLGTMTFRQVVDLLANSEGMFYVNTMTETFCVSAVLAEILKSTPYIYCINGYGALKEVLNSDTVTTDIKQFFNDVVNQRKSNVDAKKYCADVITAQWLTIFND